MGYSFRIINIGECQENSFTRWERIKFDQQKKKLFSGGGVFYQVELEASLNKNPTPWGFSRNSPVPDVHMLESLTNKLDVVGEVLDVDNKSSDIVSLRYASGMLESAMVKGRPC